MGHGQAGRQAHAGQASRAWTMSPAARPVMAAMPLRIVCVHVIMKVEKGGAGLERVVSCALHRFTMICALKDGHGGAYAAAGCGAVGDAHGRLVSQPRFSFALHAFVSIDIQQGRIFLQSVACGMCRTARVRATARASGRAPLPPPRPKPAAASRNRTGTRMHALAVIYDVRWAPYGRSYRRGRCVAEHSVMI